MRPHPMYIRACSKDNRSIFPTKQSTVIVTKYYKVAAKQLPNYPKIITSKVYESLIEVLAYVQSKLLCQVVVSI